MLLGFILISNLMYSQTSPRFIRQDDPMVGDWKFNADSSKHSVIAPFVGGEDYVQILPGMEVGMIAKTNPSTKNYERATYFVATKDANKIYFSISESHFVKMAGKDVSYHYEYHKASDMLVFTIGFKKYYYSRIK
jgi:hypothetical protein